MVQNINKKLILIVISSLTIILGLFKEVADIFMHLGFYGSDMFQHRFCPNLTLKIYNHTLMLCEISEHVKVNCADMVIYGILLIGLIKLIISKKEKNNLILFAFTILFIYNLFSLSFGQFFGRISFSPISSFIWTILSFIAIKLSTPKISSPAISSHNTKTKQVPKYIRLIHFLLDPFCFILIIFEFNYAFEIRGLDIFSSIFYILVCYIVCESVTGTTPVKALTNTTVVNINGGKQKRILIILRNILRFIPFEFASYLFTKNGWHDKFSKSLVIKIIK